MDKSLIKKAYKRSTFTYCKFKVCAFCYDRRGRLLGITYALPRFNKQGGGLHAEMLGLQRWGTRIKRITLVRFGKSGDFLPIDPCKNCNRVLNKLNIKVDILESK